VFSKTRLTIKEIFALRRNGYSGPFFMGMTLFLSGLWLLLPFWSTFEELPANYEIASQFASEEAWGFFMIAASLVTIISALARKPREVAIGALMAAGAWFLLLASVIASSLAGIVVPIMFVLMVRSVSLFREFRLAFDPVTGERYPH
jgi:hypothetical protein